MKRSSKLVVLSTAILGIWLTTLCAHAQSPLNAPTATGIFCDTRAEALMFVDLLKSGSNDTEAIIAVKEVNGNKSVCDRATFGYGLRESLAPIAGESGAYLVERMLVISAYVSSEGRMTAIRPSEQYLVEFQAYGIKKS